MSVYLTLRTSAGGSPEEAITEALKAAQTIDLWTEIEVNGVRVLIHPQDRLGTLVDAWTKAQARGADFCSANLVPVGAAPLAAPSADVLGDGGPAAADELLSAARQAVAECRRRGLHLIDEADPADGPLGQVIHALEEAVAKAEGREC